MYFLIEDEDLLKKYNTIGIKSVLISKKKEKLIASLTIIQLCENQNILMLMKLQIFTMKKLLS